MATRSTNRVTARPIHGRVTVVAGLLVGLLALAFTTHASTRAHAFNDFYAESWPAYAALSHGHLLGFLRLSPPYVGSLVLRAPFAMIPTVWGGGERAVYFASAIPCMLAAVALSAWLAEQPRRIDGITLPSRLGPLIYCVVNPLVLTALLAGHPEDILGGALCVAAVVLAVNDRPVGAGLAMGLAVINKPWALVVVPVVLAVLPRGRRAALVPAILGGGVLLGIVMAARVNGFGAAATGVQTTGVGSGATIFNPPQLLWWFGSHSWIARDARPGMVLLCAACAILWAVKNNARHVTADRMSSALLLLSLVLLLRAVLDPWNNIYYHVPFLFALLAYETRSGRMPAVAMLYTAIILLVVPNSRIPPMSNNLRAAVYATVMIPAICWLVSRLYLPPGFPRRLASVGHGPGDHGDRAVAAT